MPYSSRSALLLLYCGSRIVPSHLVKNFSCSFKQRSFSKVVWIVLNSILMHLLDPQKLAPSYGTQNRVMLAPRECARKQTKQTSNRGLRRGNALPFKGWIYCHRVLPFCNRLFKENCKTMQPVRGAGVACQMKSANVTNSAIIEC